MSRIVFSPPMVAAILDGRKTMTRRVAVPHDIGDVVLDFRLPYRFGERLAVAETHWAFGHWESYYKDPINKPSVLNWQFVCDRPDDIRFEAPNCALPSMDKADPGISTWYKRNARFMPTRYARLHLEVTGLRVESLQDISEADAIREGVTLIEETCECPVEAFQALWNSLHKSPDDWAGNPWVAVVQFERVLEK